MELTLYIVEGDINTIRGCNGFVINGNGQKVQFSAHSIDVDNSSINAIHSRNAIKINLTPLISTPPTSPQITE